MNAVFPKEDLQLLASILEEQLLIELPSGQVFQVKCAVKNDDLMILTQHPPGVAVDTEKIFTILEETLQWQSQYYGHEVQLFVRVSGEKLPYAKHSIVVKPKNTPVPVEEETFSQEESDRTGDSNGNGSNYLIFPPLNLPDSPSPIQEDHNPDTLLSSSIDDDYSSDTLLGSSIDDDYSSETLLNSSIDDDYSSDTDNYILETNFGSDTTFDSDTTFNSATSFLDESDNNLLEEESFDPFTDEEDLSNSKKRSLPSLPLPILLGAVLGVVVLFGGGAFFLTRSCVIGKCQELQTAENFKSESAQLMRSAKSQQQLVAVQQQLDTVISDLTKIPQWSPRHQQAQELTDSFSEQSAKINQVIKALQSASVAEKKAQTPANNIEELRTRQNLWRQAIAPLESIKSGSQLSGLAQAKLPVYKRNLQALNQQLLTEEAWLNKIETAKQVAESTVQQETTAKSANDWQRIKTAWQRAINGLKGVPSTSTAYQEAQNLLTDYQPKLQLASDRANKEMRAATLYQQAVNMASQAKAYEQKGQWQQALGSWQQAIQKMGSISQNSFNYNQAQSLIPSYSTALTEAQTKQQLYGNLTQTRTDLGNTCVNGMRFCTFSIENQNITVRLTPQYDQILQSGNPDYQSHFQTLREALGVISDNANLRLVLYNSQGQERYMKQPQ